MDAIIANWVEGGKKPESLLPNKRGAKPGSRRTPKEIERNIVKAYRRFGSNRYELVLLFKPYYLDKSLLLLQWTGLRPDILSMNPIKRLSNDMRSKLQENLLISIASKLPKDIRCSFKIKELYIAAICDDCTRLTYAEIIKDKRASTLTYSLFVLV